jgi:hypothetical protein
MADRARHPSIFKVGKVRDDGHTVTITGWGLGLCQDLCQCHRHPVGGMLTIHQDQDTGDLGLHRWRDCDCCTPWTADDLAAVLRDLATVADLAAT